MTKRVHIFKSLEEQEQFHKLLMSKSSVTDRFRQLEMMQQMDKLLHPITDKSRKIQIRSSNNPNYKFSAKNI